MCGIAGYILAEPLKTPSRMMHTLLAGIRQRGPDDEGVCLINRPMKAFRLFRAGRTALSLFNQFPHIEDHNAFLGHDVAFLHTRYAIIDPSTAGHQPFVSQDGTTCLIFNGEIYNYLELQKELEGHGISFHSRCDTEVLLEGYRLWGDGLWSKLNGFWAVVIYDLHKNTVTLARDRMGVAPLYYRQTSEGLFFCSCLSPLVDIAPSPAIDEDVYHGFLQTGLKDHDDSTFYDGIRSVPAASTVTVAAGSSSFQDAHHNRFWALPSGRLKISELSFAEAVVEFRRIFFDAVSLRLRSDVKLAFELSGGLDSSSVVAAAVELGCPKVTTYTAKIKDADEEPFARSMLERYDLDYHILRDVGAGFARDAVGFACVMEEPYDNPNDYTHHQMLRQMKREGVNVVVTGAGGDESFAGYEASFWPKAYQELKAQGTMSFLRADVYEFCRRFKTSERAVQTLRHYIVDSLRRFNRKKSNKSEAVTHPSKALAYQREYDRSSFDEQRRFHFEVGLIPYYMRSSDHFTMGIPIEHRFPFLDYRLVEFGLRLPIGYLFYNGWTKYLIRKAMEPYLPAKIIWRRRKMGFAFPYRTYFRTHRAVFRPFLERIYRRNPELVSLGGYDELLMKDSHLLWRLLSTAMWLESGPVPNL